MTSSFRSDNPSDGEPVQAARAAIDRDYWVEEAPLVEALVAAATLPVSVNAEVARRATSLVEGIRRRRTAFGGMDAFLQEYGLSSAEGVALMCVAEALLRIPDAETATRLIRDKIGTADWDQHMGHGSDLFVNASTWALMLTGRVLRLDPASHGSSGAVVERLIARTGEPVIRQAMVQAMRIMGRQFVMGRTIDEALSRAAEQERQGYRFSFDMLGEAARTRADAERYFETYVKAIKAIGGARGNRTEVTGPGLSVKLSALHPRFEATQRDAVLTDLVPKLLDLVTLARKAGIGMTVDTEEADRLGLTLDLFERVYTDRALDGWAGFGLAVQAYQKRAPAVIGWLRELARSRGRRIMIRLVKGAYWDSEIKRAQERGVVTYPVFTRKASTDTCYIACIRQLFDAGRDLYPQFATHNAHSAAVVQVLAGKSRDFEYQRLHGMGEPLYEQLVGTGPDAYPCRVYAPVGNHEELLSYLVRRLLENGANSSFVNRIRDLGVPVAEFVTDPVATTAARTPKAHPRIPLPPDLFGAERRNSKGLDFSDPLTTEPLLRAMEAAWAKGWKAAPIVAGRAVAGASRPVHDPADRTRVAGTLVEGDAATVDAAMTAAHAARRAWSDRPVEDRARCLERAADLYEDHLAELMALAVREAGKTIPDALAEVREAVDFLRYYAVEARRVLAPRVLQGPTGELNRMTMHGKGVFVCISPWNFPLAIFTGQVAAALVAGNTVVTKPAEQTGLMAGRAVALFYEAGIPPDVLHFVPGPRETVGEALIGDPRVAGVAFTGSVATARRINRRLAERDGAIPTLIAETGGLNAMIVDSSALAEQVVDDVLTSAFRSAGQRCSALRVLYLQDQVADRLLTMLEGASRELRIGDPSLLQTDVGPVIDETARERIWAHCRRMRSEAKPLFEVPLPPSCSSGTFVAPVAFEIGGIRALADEVFGPVLHVVRYGTDSLDTVMGEIEQSGYGLTVGVHSRIEQTQQTIVARLPVGNRYVNRSMIGAVVGVQPFGGEGLSGTGPKAGGPHYVLRFATERAVSINTAAAGGNAALVSMSED